MEKFLPSTSRLSYNNLRPLNIEISKRLEDDTDIFLSDQRFYDVDCEQMIWESPPLAEDWEQLGDLIVKIKQNDKKIINS
ncbi:hypothetical protein [Pediococcus pentosaceus]|uniref:hypothetical protein n=1 Tax=Pediococcus pentosaceus TaxID=1255 RepID=UPI001E55990B|nr:hypothetical protein [Pediococcus pentosaceus]